MENILKIYKDNKTNMRKDLKEKNNDLKEIIKNINAATKPEEYVFRTEKSYPMTRPSLKEVLKRSFETEKYRKFSPEHAQKFYLYAYGVKHKKELPYLGYIITYELPFFEKRNGGAIDLVAYDKINNQINLIEMKNCQMGDKKASGESLIRAILEIETYTKCINLIVDYEKTKKNVLKEKLRRTLKKIYNINIPKKTFYKAPFVKTLLIPESLYENSLNNPKEKNILGNLPKDIKINFLKFKSDKFDTKQTIETCASKKELEMKIYTK